MANGILYQIRRTGDELRVITVDDDDINRHKPDTFKWRWLADKVLKGYQDAKRKDEQG